MKESALYQTIRDRVAREFPKEYRCHIQFVVEIARDLQKKKGGDREIVDIAAVAHDIGRVSGEDNAQHPEKGAERINKWIQESGGMDAEKRDAIARSVMMHNKKRGFQTIEEEIISNADALSKLLYHETFMLMCRKETYDERARWGLKYSQRAFENLTFDDVRKEVTLVYQELIRKYTAVLQ